MVPFTKGHGLGNDYIVMDQRDLDGPLTPGRISALCDRHLGIGADGILLRVSPTAGADFGVRIFNPDGSEAEKSGNGLRIFAKYLWDNSQTVSAVFSVETRGGRVECQCHPANGRMNDVTVEMGRCTFRASEIPMSGDDREVVNESIQVGEEALVITAVSLGNPHCVVFTDHLDESVVRGLGPRLETHSSFPNRTNVQFAWVVSRNEAAIMIWERGAGWTRASGSSSCGVAAAAVRTGRCDPGPITVTMPGGTLQVEVRPDWSLRLRGPVEEAYRGQRAANLS